MGSAHTPTPTHTRTHTHTHTVTHTHSTTRFILQHPPSWTPAPSWTLATEVHELRLPKVAVDCRRRQNLACQSSGEQVRLYAPQNLCLLFFKFKFSVFDLQIAKYSYAHFGSCIFLEIFCVTMFKIQKSFKKKMSLLWYCRQYSQGLQVFVQYK